MNFIYSASAHVWLYLLFLMFAIIYIDIPAITQFTYILLLSS